MPKAVEHCVRNMIAKGLPKASKRYKNRTKKESAWAICTSAVKKRKKKKG